MNVIKEGLARRPEGESQMSLIDRLREFLEMEARSGSMDLGASHLSMSIGCGEEALRLRTSQRD